MNRDSTSVSKMPLKNLENPQAYTSINQQIMTEQLTYDVSEVLKNVPGMVKMQEAREEVPEMVVSTIV